MTGDVGYGRPPIESRYQKGRSGNPSGRPKKRPSTYAEDVLDVLALPVTARSGDKQVQLKTLEAMFLRLCQKGLNGEKRALVAAIDMIEMKVAAEADRKHKPIDMGEVNRKLRAALGLRPLDPDEPSPPPPEVDPAVRKANAEAMVRWRRNRDRGKGGNRRRLFDE